MDKVANLKREHRNVDYFIIARSFFCAKRFDKCENICIFYDQIDLRDQERFLIVTSKARRVAVVMANKVLVPQMVKMVFGSW